MAVHKVPLDVEADDKFLGPLSFKQFLFGGGTVVFGYITFLTLTKGLWPVSVIFIIPTLLGAVFTFPWSKEQPSELFLASRIRFYIKPRKRIWDQSGMKHLVEITAPKQIVHEMTDGLNQVEVRSRFNALATMVDSRGWAVKHATAGAATADTSDRLVSPTAPIPTEQQVVLQSTPDIMDEDNSTIARQFDSMIEKSTVAQKSAARDIVAKARQDHDNPQTAPTVEPNDAHQNFWFTEQNATTVQPTNQSATTLPTTQSTGGPLPVSAPPLLTEEELLEKAHEKQRRDALQTGIKHGTTINPDGSVSQSGGKLPAADNTASGVADGSTDDTATNTSTSSADQPEPQLQDNSVQTPIQDPQTQTSNPVQPAPYSVPDTTQHPQYQPPQVPVTKKLNPDILELAQSNDLNIETLARQAHKNDDGEVVISLH